MFIYQKFRLKLQFVGKSDPLEKFLIYYKTMIDHNIVKKTTRNCGVYLCVLINLSLYNSYWHQLIEHLVVAW